MLGVSIALNSLSLHGACTAVFVAVAAIITFFLSSVQTLGRLQWLAWFGLASILISSKRPSVCFLPSQPALVWFGLV